MRRHWLAIALAGLVMATGCSKDDSSSGGGGEVAPKSGAEGASSDGPVIEAVVAQELQGNWESTCNDAQVFGLTENSSLKVTDTSMLRTTRFHSNGTCSESAVEVEQVAAFVKGDAIQASTYGIDISISSIKVKPVSATGVQILKLANFCGISDWSLNAQRDVSAATGTDRCFPTVPATIYQIYSVDANRLSFGKVEQDPLTPDKRPTELDSETYFTKQ